MTKYLKMIFTAIILTLLVTSSFIFSTFATSLPTSHQSTSASNSSIPFENKTTVSSTDQFPNLIRESSKVISPNKSLLHVVWPGFDDQPKPPKNYPRDNSSGASGESADDIPEHPAWGTQLWQLTNGVFGVFAQQFYRTDLDLDTNPHFEKFLYAPTLTGPEPCPLEAVTAYVCQSYSSYTTHRYFAVFDFSLGEEGEWTDLAIDFSSSQWQNSYQLGFEPNYYYYVRIISDPDGNNWVVQLWNKTCESWQQVFPEEGGHDEFSGGPRLDNGWDMFETYYYNESWPADIPQIRSKELSVYTRSWASGEWYYYWSYAYEYECASTLTWNWNPPLSYDHDYKYALYEWYVGTAPTAYVDDVYWYGGYGGYCVENPENLIGIADASYVHMHCCNYGDTAQIIADMGVTLSGDVTIYGHSGCGGYLSDMYVYALDAQFNWYYMGMIRVTDTSPQPIYIGYASNFRYLEIAGYDSGYSVCLYLDAIRVT